MSTPEQPCGCEQSQELAVQLIECGADLIDAGNRIGELRAELVDAKKRIGELEQMIIEHAKLCGKPYGENND